MHKRKWKKADKTVLKVHHFPWVTFGTMIIITVTSLLFGTLSFFVHDVKYKQVSTDLVNLRTSYQQLRENIELIKNQNEFLQEENRVLTSRSNPEHPSETSK